MDKEKYYEMCEALGSEPDPNKVPPDFEDLAEQTQEAYQIFNYLPDMYSDMSGGFIGKDLSNIFIFMELYGIERGDWLLYMDFLTVLTNDKKKRINDKIQAEMNAAKRKGANKSGR